jgi:hypothetical protein
VQKTFQVRIKTVQSASVAEVFRGKGLRICKSCSNFVAKKKDNNPLKLQEDEKTALHSDGQRRGGGSACSD